MSACPPDPPAPPEIPSPPQLSPPPVGRTRLVTLAAAPRPPYSANRECDALTAVKRGLKEYLEQVYVDYAGVRVRFERVLDVWAESDEVALYPTAVVQAIEEATYDASSLTPSIFPTPVAQRPGAASTYLVKYSELTCTLLVELHTSSPEERSQCSMLLEDALNPVTWMHGFKLDLPHYFGQRAVFSPARTQQTDSEDNARRRWRPGSVLLDAQISVVRTMSLPGLTPQVVLEVEDGSA